MNLDDIVESSGIISEPPNTGPIKEGTSDSARSGTLVLQGKALDSSVQQSEGKSPAVVPKEKSIAQLREGVRGVLAQRLITLVCVTAGAALLVTGVDYANAVFRDRSPDREFTKDVLSLLLTSNAALAGAALGFYFGDKSSKD